MKLTRASALMVLIALFMSLAGLYVLAAEPPKTAEPGAKISYYKEVRPIFAQHCNGCHQPAKPQGGFIMTAHADLLKAGERDKRGVVPGKPASSYLLEQIKPHDGKAEMPKGRDPLNPIQIKLIADWVAQGAADDTPASAKADPVDAANPPRYLAPPVVTSLDFDAKGEFLAVAGYHEVLLYSAKDFHLVSRLIGISERINTVAFSPNGERLAVAGGSPGRFGEVQVWNPRKENLLVSAPVTFDTVYGLELGAGRQTARRRLLGQHRPRHRPAHRQTSPANGHAYGLGADHGLLARRRAPRFRRPRSDAETHRSADAAVRGQHDEHYTGSCAAAS